MAQIIPTSIKQGDDHRSLLAILPDNEVLDVTSVDILLLGVGVAFVLPTVSVADRPGVFEHVWKPGETSRIGRYKAEVRGTWPDGKTQSWPPRGFFSFSITPDLDLAGVPVVVLPTALSYPIRSTGIPGINTLLVWNGDGWVPSPVPQGSQGVVGPVGDIGLTGPQGVAGVIGPQGLIGQTGPQGAVGPQGVIGPQGIQGFKGDTGDVGVQGIQGTQGPQGPDGTGTMGAQGPAGPQGPAGVDGATGTQGAAGAAGNQGPIGATGNTGAVGASGPAGVQGLTGTIGPQGATGAAGAIGPQGVAGAVGANGVVNPRGAWTAGVVYPAGDAVSYTDLIAYVAKIAAFGYAPNTTPTAVAATPVINTSTPSRYASPGNNVYPGGGQQIWRVEILASGTLIANGSALELYNAAGASLQGIGSASWTYNVLANTVYYIRCGAAADFTLTGTATINTNHASPWVAYAASPEGVKGVGTLLFRDTFATDTLVNYTADGGTSQSGLSIANDLLTPAFTADHQLHRNNLTMIDGKVMMKIIPGSNDLTLGLRLRWLDDNNFLQVQTYTADPNVRIFSSVAGVVSEIGPGVGRSGFVTGRPYWMILRVIGDTVQAELWDRDPRVYKTPTYVTGLGILTGAAKTAVGAGISGKIGMRIQSSSSGATPMAVDEFIAVDLSTIASEVF